MLKNWFSIVLITVFAAACNRQPAPTPIAQDSATASDSLKPFAVFVYDSNAVQPDVDFIALQADSSAFMPFQEGLYRAHVLLMLGKYDAFCRWNQLPIDSNAQAHRLQAFFHDSNLPISQESTLYYYKNTDKTYTQEVFYGKKKGFIIVEYGFK